MSLRIQSPVDLGHLDATKTIRNGVSPTSVGVGGQQEVEPIRESIRDAINESTKRNDVLFRIKPDEVERESVEKAVDSINGAIAHVNRGLRFSVHEDTQRLMVKVVDILTDEVIKELPPEDVLDTAARIKDAIGLLIDERA